MSTDELRRMLDYPDDGFVVDLVAIRERAHQHQARRRRLGALGVIGAACAVATAVSIGPLTGSGPRNVLVVPGDEVTTSSTTSPAPDTSTPVTSTPVTSTPVTSTPVTSPATHAATVVKASGGTRVPMGQDWSVWVGANGQVCRSSPPDKPGGARYQPFGCRSTTDGNIAGLGIQSSSSLTGTMYSAVIPYARARVDAVIDGKHLAADTVRFDRLPNWTFYYLWVPGRVDLRDIHVGVIAYDRNGTELDRFGVN